MASRAKPPFPCPRTDITTAPDGLSDGFPRPYKDEEYAFFRSKADLVGATPWSRSCTILLEDGSVYRRGGKADRWRLFAKLDVNPLNQDPLLGTNLDSSVLLIPTECGLFYTGPCKDFRLCLRMVNGDGEVTRFPGFMAKASWVYQIKPDPRTAGPGGEQHQTLWLATAGGVWRYFKGRLQHIWPKAKQ